MSEKIDAVIRSITDIGGTFKFGNGFMGKSSIVILVLFILGLVFIIKAPWLAGSVALILMISIFIYWFNKILKFSSEHPDAALLEGAEWRAWSVQTMQQKGGPPMIIPGEEVKLISNQGVKKRK